jgi:HlyD family secretion protein
MQANENENKNKETQVVSEKPALDQPIPETGSITNPENQTGEKPPALSSPSRLTPEKTAPKQLSRPGARKPRRKRRRWLIWLIFLVIVGGAGAGYYYWQNSNQPAPGFQGQTTPATRSPVSLTVSASGQVQANAELKLSFGTAGTVTEVLAKPGDPVKSGQVLARINDQDLQNALKTSLASLNAAKADLEKTKAGSSEEDIKKAEEQVKQARLKAEQTRNGNALPDEVQSARSKLEASKAKLEQLKQGGSQADKAKAQSALSSAEADLASSQAKLNKLQAGPDLAEISDAQSKLDKAQADLEQTKSNLYNRVIQAQVARDQALTSLNKAQDAYSSIYRENHNADGSLKGDRRDENIQKETNAYRDLQDAQGNYNKADIALNDARVNYDTGLKKAQIEVDNAKTQLEKTKAGPAQSDIAAAEAAVASSKANLDNARANLAKLTPTEADLVSAQAEVDAAQSSLAKLTTGGTASEIATQESNVRVQELTLQELLKGPAPSDIATKQAQVDLKQADYDKAQTNLETANLKAPFDGILTSLSLVPGQTVAAGTEVGQLIDDSQLHVDVNVEESNIGKIKLNQPVSLSFEALPNQSFSGKITFISPKAQVNSNVVSYLVTVTLDGTGKNSLQETYPEQYSKFLQGLLPPLPAGQGNASTTTTPDSNNNNSPVGKNGPQSITFEGGAGPLINPGSTSFCGYNPASGSREQLQPKVGMTANVTVCLDVKAGTLSVPNRAVKSKIDNGRLVSYVEVLEAGDKIEQTTVSTGLRGDSLTEISGGELKEGDKVVTSTEAASSGNSPQDGLIQFSGPPGGGPGAGNGPVIISR